MPANEIHVDDVGTTFSFTIGDENGLPVNLSGVDISIYLKKPDNSLVTKTPTLVNSGVGGEMQYIAVAGDLNLHGIYGLQAYLNFGLSGWYTDVQNFQVYRNL